MKKSIVMLSLLVGFTIGNIGNVEASELINNKRKIAQPEQSKHEYKSFEVRRFILGGNSEADYYNLVNAVAREVGSDNQKIVKIIWNNKMESERIQKALVEKGILEDRVNLIKNTKKRPLYPIYVEVESISTKSKKCRVTTAERMVIYREHIPCALENNNRIQKRN